MRTPAGLETVGLPVALEGGDWLTCRRAETALAGISATELLARGARLAGTLRYGLSAGDAPLLCGEVRCSRGPTALIAARDRLGRLVQGPAETGPVPEEDELEAALAGSGLAWARREAGWAVPVTDGVPREIQLQGVPGGARAEAVLTAWDEIRESAATALARLLARAHVSLRLVRCELADRCARVVSFTETDYLDTDLPYGLRALAVACQLLAREAQALLLPEMTRVYLDFC